MGYWADDKQNPDIELMISGTNKNIPAEYIKNALSNGKNIAVIGADTKEMGDFAKCMMKFLHAADIFLLDAKSSTSIMECFPDSNVVMASYMDKERCMDENIFFIDEAECQNLRQTLPKFLLYNHANGIRRQTISVYRADNNRQAILRITKMLNQDSMSYSFKECSRIVCELLCEVCILVRSDAGNLIISEIWENRTDAQNEIKQEMVILHTDRGYFHFPECADVFSD